MATNSKQSIDTGLETTVMALREVLMQYFKGSCVMRLTDGAGIMLHKIQKERPQYQYQRQQAELENEQLVMLGGVPILTVKHSPDELIYHIVALGRSKQLRQLHRLIEQFLSEYLPNVERSNSDANITE